MLKVSKEVFEQYLKEHNCYVDQSIRSNHSTHYRDRTNKYLAYKEEYEDLTTVYKVTIQNKEE